MAGASMKDIKLRIKSVESTMQITKAMQLVATSKLRRAKERMESSKPYAHISREAIAAAVAQCADSAIPYIAQRPLKKRCYVVIAGDRGLAGGYNANVFKAMDAHREDAEYCVLPLGRKAIEKFIRMKAEVISDAYPKVEGMTVGNCYQLAQLIIDGYLQEKYDQVWLVYTGFQSMMTQEVAMEQLLPLPKTEKEEKRLTTTIYDMEIGELLKIVTPDFLSGRLYSALCDSFASEVASRRNAMDSATKNAGEMINDLRLKYNRARQGAITQEITEIVAGAEQ